MNKVLPIILGVVSGLFGVMMVHIAPDSQSVWLHYGFGAFCLAICGACFLRGRAQEFLLCLIAACFLGAGIWYFIDSVRDVYAGKRGSRSSLVGSIFYLCTFGLMAGSVLWTFVRELLEPAERRNRRERRRLLRQLRRKAAAARREDAAP